MNFIGYARVSTDEQVRSGVSLDVQESKIRDYAKLNDLELTQIVRDEGESGKNLQRPGIQQIIRQIDNPHIYKQISGIIVYKLDRLSRKVIDTLNLIEKLDSHGVAFHSITEKIDTKSAMGKFFITILSALAQMERDMISERTKGALNYKRSQGGLAGGVPYGYRSHGRKKEARLTKDNTEQKILRTILEVHNSGKSYNWIANELNRSGIPSRCGRKWYPQTVKSIIIHTITDSSLQR